MIPIRRPGQRPLRASLALFLLPLCASGAASSGSDDVRREPWPAAVVELAERLPIQDGGRIKPLHTFAGFTLLRLHGTRRIETPEGERLTPVEWLLDVLFFPAAACDYAVFIVQNAEVVEAIGVSREGKKKRDRYSFNELRPGVPRLFGLAREYARIEPAQRSAVQEQIHVLAGNVAYFTQLLSYLDFARERIPVGPGERLSALFAGRDEVAFSDVVRRVGALRELYDELAGNASLAGSTEVQSATDLLRTAASLTDGADSMALVPPAAGASVEEWRTPADLLYFAVEHGSLPDADAALLAGFEELSRRRDDPAAFERELAAMHGTLVGRAQARGEYEKIGLEVTYYKSKVLDYSHYLFVLGFLAMAFMWLRPRSKILYAATSGSVAVATLLLIAGIAVRCAIRGRPPVSTLYETVLFVTAVGCVIAMFMEGVGRLRVAISCAAILGTIGLFVANGYEVLDKRDTMPSLVAVLDTNFWLATHVTAITIGYSGGMLAALLASVYLVTKALGLRRRDRSFYASLGRMVYGVLCFAMIFSVVGTILGGIWANDSWGRFWGWDPKENGALLIVISQIAILHARMGGYLREHGVCMAAAFGGTVVAFSWWGVNLLGVGLHSYGFTSGISTALWTYYALQWSVVGLGALTWLLARARAREPVERSRARDMAAGAGHTAVQP